MHFERFNLARPPFASPPSPAALFLGAGHREALAALEWGLGEPSGFTLLTGEVGTGKTTLIAALLAGRAAGLPIVRLWNPHLSFNEILRESLVQLGIETDDLSRFGLLGRLLRAAKRERVVMIFDEAQQLDDGVLEDLRLLSNAQSAEGPALQIILVGQPELLARLGSHAMRQLNQRIGARAILRTLDAREVLDYLDCRIRAAGGSVERVFSPAALRALTRHAHGIPRRINLLCDNAMLLASLDGSARVAPGHLEEAVREYDQPAHLASALRASVPIWGWERIRAAASLLVVLSNTLPELMRSAGLSRAAQQPGRPSHAPGADAAHPASVLRIWVTGWGWGSIGAAAGLMVVLSVALPQFLRSPASSRAPRHPGHPSHAPADAAHPGAVRVPPLSASHIKPAGMPAESAADLAVVSAFATEATASREVDSELVRVADPATVSKPTSAFAEQGRAAERAGVAHRNQIIVRAGESLSAIATRHLGSIRYLKRLEAANPQISDPNRIYAGQSIRLGGK